MTDISPAEHLARALRAAVAGTLRSTRSPELNAIAEVEERDGQPDISSPANGFRVPDAWLPMIAKRAPLAATLGGANGGYTVGTSFTDFTPSLQQLSIAGLLGAEFRPVARDVILQPRGSSNTAVAFVAEGATIPESEQVFGQVACTPRFLQSFTKVSRQLAIQSNLGEVLQTEILRSGAAAVDDAVFGPGTGAAPNGLFATTGVGTGSGTSLAFAGVVTAQTAVANAGGIERLESIGWAADPTTAALLLARYEGTNQPRIWSGALSRGAVCGAPAFSSKSMPANSLAFGDWSQAVVLSWAAPVIETDPYSAFASGVIAVRLTWPIDILIRAGGSFYTIGSIT